MSAIQIESGASGEAAVTHSEYVAGTTRANRLLLAADLAGTLVFAVEGAMAAVNGNLDLVGIMTLAFCTALGGGIIRDTLLGALPPAALGDWRYPTIALTAAVLVFALNGYVRAIPAAAIQTLDAAGLAIFAIAGTEKAIIHKMNPLVAVLLGTITGVGGGTVRDILIGQVPTVLRSEVYATAAAVGSIVLIVATKIRVPPNLAAGFGGIVCFLLRVISLWRHWNVPKALGH
jgi:uncharacterized membrane protein YeiH